MTAINYCVAIFYFLSIASASISLAHSKESAAEAKTGRELRWRRHGAKVRKGHNKISGTYIVRLADDTSAYNVKGLAKKHAFKMRDIVKKTKASGTVIISNSTEVVRPGRVYTSSIKGFTLTGVPDELALSLINMTGVISVEQDEFVSINSPRIIKLSEQGRHLTEEYYGYYGTDTSGNSSCPQTIPWGIKRVGGPIRLNPSSLGRVFVIDTGISLNADLNIDTALSVDFVGDGTSIPAWSDANGHGTHVAGTIGAIDNCLGVAGIVPGATVVAVRVLDSTGNGPWSRVIAGIDYVASKGKPGDVANLSFAGAALESADNAVLIAAKRGIKFAIAAGNNANDASNYSPARVNATNVYTVSAFDQYGYMCFFSNYGSPPIKFSGPGENVWSLSNVGGIALDSGTSMAAPHIAGLLLAGNITEDGYVLADKDSVPDPIAYWGH